LISLEFGTFYLKALKKEENVTLLHDINVKAMETGSGLEAEDIQAIVTWRVTRKHLQLHF
jgi:hypothetical protein